MPVISAKHILVNQKYEAEDIIRKLNDGEAFEKLAERFSKCPSKARGGDLGSFPKGKMVESFDEAAFELEVGEVSKPVSTRFGYHLIYRYA